MHPSVSSTAVRERMCIGHQAVRPPVAEKNRAQRCAFEKGERPWLSLPSASCLTAACTSGTRPAAGTRR
ncbi:hypothetical protein ACFPRL_08115 [Pseudoclavibacter helvolus]